MTKVIVDAVMQAQLQNLSDLLEVCDESGKTLGYFHPTAAPAESGSEVRSPFSQEELERRRQQRSGRPLAEILEGLKQS